MQRLISKVTSLLTLSFALVFASNAYATSVSPGDTVTPSAVTLSGVTLLADTTGAWTNSTSTMSGAYAVGVYSDPSNVYGAGDLDFVYQVSNSSGSTDSVNRITAINFTNALTNIGYTTTGSTLPGGAFLNGTIIPVSGDRSLAGNTIGFNFTPPIAGGILAGDTSYVLIIETNATTFAAGNFNLIDGGVTTLAAYQPTFAAMPEPSSWSFVAVLLVGMFLMVRSRKFRLVNVA